MNTSTGRYVIGMEVVTPTGMNLDIANSVATANLSRLGQSIGDDGIERFTYSKIEYTNHKLLFEKTCELSGYLIESLLKQLPNSLKLIPLLIAIPNKVPIAKMQDWLDQSAYSSYLSTIEVVHSSGPSFVQHSINSLDKYDALMCVSVDSLVDSIDDLMNDAMVMSTKNPWGIIPSEGGAGLLFARRNTIKTFKLVPKAQIGYLNIELNNSDRRGMFRLVQRASKQVELFGEVYSDMSNLRAHTEDYGFALGAKAERFTNPQQPHLINELWGTMGCCSSFALIAYAIQNHHFNQATTLLMFDTNGDKGLLQLLAP